MAEVRPDPVGRVSRLTGWRSLLLSAIAGAGVSLGQAPFGLFWVAFPALGLAIFMGFSSHSPRQAAWRGGQAGFAFGLITFFWIVEPFLVDIKSHGWMAPFALFSMAAGIGLFWAGAFWAARRIVPGGSWALALAIPVFWTGAELLRSYVLTGFPWALTSYIWIDTPVYQLASLSGPHGLGFGTLLLASGMVICPLKRKLFALLLCTAIIAGAVAGGTMLQNRAPADTVQPGPVVRLIQPNASQHQKWDPEMIPIFYNRQLTLSAQPANPPVDLVIWPEVAVPFLLNDETVPLWEVWGAGGGVPVIIGGQNLEGFRAYNSLIVLEDGGEITGRYDKHHLVPLGEYIPAGWLLSRIGLKALTAQHGFGYSAGSGPATLDLGPLGIVMPLICYEAIFPHEMRRVTTRPDWMLLITNDAWFGAFSGPYQHLAQARARAIEFGLPMVRVANTGVSAVIDPRGKIVNSLPLGVAGRLDVGLPAPLAPTLYWKTGDSPVFILLIVLGLGLLSLNARLPIDRRSA